MGGVIRNDEFVSSPAFSFEDIEQRARRIIEEAEARARETIQKAESHARKVARESQAHIQSLTEQQRQEGLRQGLAEGREQGARQAREDGREVAVKEAREQLSNAIHALNAGFSEFEQQKRALLALAESGLIELALEIARRVCKSVASSSSEAARETVRTLLDMVAHHDDITLQLNPADAELLNDVADEFVQHIGTLEHVHIVPDGDVDRGGCILRSRAGTIDARCSTQLDRIAAAICPPRDGDASVPASPEVGS